MNATIGQRRHPVQTAVVQPVTSIETTVMPVMMTSVQSKVGHGAITCHAVIDAGIIHHVVCESAITGNRRPREPTAVEIVGVRGVSDCIEAVG